MVRNYFIAVCIIGILAGCSTAAPGLRRQVHVVETGDTLSGIARKYDVSVADLTRVNQIPDPDSIRIGARLTIPPGTGVAPVFPKKDVTRSRLQPSQQPQTTLSAVPGNSSPQPQAFIWPLEQVDISSHFGSRFFSDHKGIDLRAPLGTPILAAADGEVIYAGRASLWGGYGKMIKIQHAGGLVTVYAHNDCNYAVKGQRVRQGETIATVGSTGNATGYHVHFEMRKNGKAIDPEDYMPSQ